MASEGDEREGEPASYDPERVRTERSYGNVGDSHWSNTRAELHQEELEHLRARSRAPGVAEGGALRNHYCLKCHGVIPLDYAMTESAETIPVEHCPHCGEELEGNVRMMFNWVEIDQVHGSDARALLPLALAGLAALALLALAAWWLLAD